jgi:hypothetical protein
MLKVIEEMVLEKLEKHPELATFGISIAISFTILLIMGTISESHQAFAGGIPEPTHR